MEDGCYCNSSFRTYVHSQLAPQLDILSMNEDEMQQYIDKKIDILNPKDVRGAIEYIYKNIGVDNIIIHSAEWALAYGKNAYELKNALEGGVIMASTRFRIGDEFTIQDYENTKKILDKVTSVHFCRSIMKSIGEKVYFIPCKDLSNVKNPTIVGLCDSFAVGMSPHVLRNNMI